MGEARRMEEAEIDEFEVVDLVPAPLLPRHRKTKWRWIKIIGIAALGVALSIVFAIWILPLLLDKIVIPVLVWVASRFKRHQLALVLMAALSIFPVLLIPSGPPMWLSGIIFGYGIGFIIIMVGTTIGQTLPYFVGHYLFHHRIQEWLSKWPRKAAVLRAAESGGWFHQFRTVTLLRVAPIPYTLFNYAIAATNIEFWPYIAGSIAGMVPEAFITIYSGRLLKSLADAKHAKRHMNAVEITYNVVGFCVALAAGVSLTAYGRRALQEMELKAEQQLPTSPSLQLESVELDPQRRPLS
ncbi:uncharacterized protein LOC9650446 [Selaginella moellendorffii]|nr:uncharacterized protein LOC9650446 [Selaginella moellendorffii]|eukprot:XP_002989360.2 uncharacterized protein LOC9650446 [Selaginella moellendorffii]